MIIGSPATACCHPSRCVLRMALCGAVLALAVVAGCQDPYSVRRIQRRVDHMADLAADLNKIELRRQARLREVEPTLKKWLQGDAQRSRERFRAAGDYLW